MSKSIVGNENNSQNQVNNKAKAWDSYFMTWAYLASMRSLDPSTRVGAVIIGPDHELRASGYNGLPRGVLDLDSRYLNKIYKYQAGNHAEENAILHCARMGGASTKGCIMYTTWIPCAQCAKMIIQAGIEEVIYHEFFPGNHDQEPGNWQESILISKEILQEANVILRSFHGDLIKIQGKYKGKNFDLF